MFAASIWANIGYVASLCWHWGDHPIRLRGDCHPARVRGPNVPLQLEDGARDAVYVPKRVGGPVDSRRRDLTSSRLNIMFPPNQQNQED
jgi:hypothetical protein